MIGFDTNALIRLLVEDDAPQAAAVRKRLAALDDVAEAVFLNDIVLVETLWTLRRSYGFERTRLHDLLGQLLATHTFGFENRQVVTLAAQWYGSSAADFSDCLIAAKNAALGCELTVSFDRGMKALPGVELLRA